MTPRKNLIHLAGRRKAWITAAGVLVLAAGLGGARLAGRALAQAHPVSSWPAAKASLWENQQLALSRARTHPMPKSAVGSPPTPRPVPSQAPITGIISTHQGPFSPQQFAVSNVWTGYVNGQYYTLYAGSEQHPGSGAPPQAGVILYSDPANVNSGMSPTRVGVYLAGQNESSLTVQSASGSRILLSGKNGMTTTFNVITRRFG